MVSRSPRTAWLMDDGRRGAAVVMRCTSSTADVAVCVRSSANQFVEHHTEGVHVGAHVEIGGVAADLLGAHVRQRADDLAGGGLESARAELGVEDAGDAEVEHLRQWRRATGETRGRGLSFVDDEYVLGLQVSVNHAARLGMLYRVADIREESDALPQVQRVLLDEFRDRVRPRPAPSPGTAAARPCRSFR